MRIPFARPLLSLRCMADHVSLARGGVSARRSIAPSEQAPGAPRWRAALDALAGLLAEGKHGAGRARVVLSDRFVHYCLIPAEAGIARADELCAFARHAYRAEYGAAVDGWRVCADTDAAGTAVAALVDGELCEQLAAVCGRAGLRLDSLAPHFGAAQAALAQRLGKADAWFAVLEACHLAAGLHAGGTWRHLVSARLAGASGAVDAGAIIAALDAQSIGLPAARAVRRVHLTLPDGRRGPLAAGNGWSLQGWPEPGALPA